MSEKAMIPDSLIEAALAKLQADGDPEDFYSSVLIPAPEAAELSYALVPAEWVSHKKLSKTRRELLWALRKLGRKKREADLRCAGLAAERDEVRAELRGRCHELSDQIFCLETAYAALEAQLATAAGLLIELRLNGLDDRETGLAVETFLDALDPDPT